MSSCYNYELLNLKLGSKELCFIFLSHMQGNEHKPSGAEVLHLFYNQNQKLSSIQFL